MWLHLIVGAKQVLNLPKAKRKEITGGQNVELELDRSQLFCLFDNTDMKPRNF